VEVYDCNNQSKTWPHLPSTAYHGYVLYLGFTKQFTLFDFVFRLYCYVFV